ncbi:hypothetical protein E3N88_36123 [Mikania micrantha]|uniref:RRM domain-containing protein n=1 Tax=Mikania micrantha TaxID=192012 RepID=A0A5N6M5N5_9ASTR|nr:hypothetical protein E3N88_36123 [Mikania micrantha]
MDERDEGEWTRVHNRRRRPMTGIQKRASPITSFFVSNLPDGCSSKQLEKAFGAYGNLVDSYVARKKDSRGNYFGFVRFELGMGDYRYLLQGLNTIRIEGAKVSVNLAKYNKDKQRIIPKGFRTISEQPSILGRVPILPNQDIRNRSYSEVLTGNRSKQPQPVKIVTLPYNSAWFPETCRKRSLVCEAKDLNSLVSAKQVLNAEGVVGITEMVYIGGLNSLITFMGSKAAKDFIQNGEHTWKLIFNKVVIWDGQDLPTERIVRINIHGVPLLVRDEATFNRIGERFGRILIPSDFSWDDEDVSYGKVHVLTKSVARIDEDIKIEWRNSTYMVRVIEDQTTWTPVIDEPLDDQEIDDPHRKFILDSEHEFEPQLPENMAPELVNDLTEGGALEGEQSPTKAKRMALDTLNVDESSGSIPDNEVFSNVAGLSKSPGDVGPYAACSCPNVNLDPTDNLLDQSNYVTQAQSSCSIDNRENEKHFTGEPISKILSPPKIPDLNDSIPIAQSSDTETDSSGEETISLPILRRTKTK